MFNFSLPNPSYICGPLKEAGLDQPITSLLFLAGRLGLANTYVIGLVENLSEGPADSFSPIHAMQTQFADACFSMLLPPSLRIVPLAIYRKIPIA
jgi:hypothetical protein